VELDDGNAFELPLPEVIERIQRREYFRLRMPQGEKRLICKVPNGDEVFGITIVDMSVGGIGASVRGTLPSFLSRGAVLTGCSIEFPVVGVVPFTLKVCSTFVSSTAKSGEKMYHIGFSFENPSRGASNVIQRHMMHIQSEGISLDSDE
jgi:c-di-GMP-binding flagellar brake protein YcgR